MMCGDHVTMLKNGTCSAGSLRGRVGGYEQGHEGFAWDDVAVVIVGLIIAAVK